MFQVFLEFFFQTFEYHQFQYSNNLAILIFLNLTKNQE